MLEITVPAREFYDEQNQEFIYTKAQTIQAEHSLVSLSKWEAKWCKPFLTKEEKTPEQVSDYIRCMTVTQNVKEEVYNSFTTDIFTKVKEYIDAPMTATWFSEPDSGSKQKPKTGIVTAELIYYWMIAQNIPMECQKWHLNRLLTLIRVCSVKNAPPQKRSKKDMLAKRRALNDTRRAQLNSKG